MVNVIRILATINSDASYVDSNITWTNNNEMTVIIKTELDDIREIVAKHPEAWKKVLDDGDIYDDEKLYYDLYEYYSSDPDYMPYGTQKARDGDPVQWITERLDDLGAFEKEMSIEEAEKITGPLSDWGSFSDDAYEQVVKEQKD